MDNQQIWHLPIFNSGIIVLNKVTLYELYCESTLADATTSHYHQSVIFNFRHTILLK